MFCVLDTLGVFTKFIEERAFGLTVKLLCGTPILSHGSDWVRVLALLSVVPSC